MDFRNQKNNVSSKCTTYIGYGKELFYWDLIEILRDNGLHENIYRYLLEHHQEILKLSGKMNECSEFKCDVQKHEEKIQNEYEKIFQCLKLYFATKEALKSNGVYLKVFESPEKKKIIIGFFTACIENELIVIMNRQFRRDDFKQLFGNYPIFIRIN